MSVSISEHRVGQYLRQHISCSEPGEPLPSFRQVMQGCKVGPQTVSTVVNRFKKEGLIEVKSQKGLFNSNQATKDWSGIQQVHVIVFAGKSAEQSSELKIAHRESGLYNNELLFHLSNELSRTGVGIRAHSLPREATNREVEQWIAAHHCSACLTLALKHEAIVSAFQKNYVPLVNMFPATASVPASSIIIDANDVVGKQIEHLIELGHRRIGYLNNVEMDNFHRDQFFRREAFYRIVAERGLPLKPGWVQYGGYNAESVTAAMEQILAGPERPTAVIAADHHLSTIYHVLSKHGLQAGENFSVVGTDDLPIAEMVHPPATTLRVPRRDAVIMALDMLKKIIKSEETESTRLLPVRMVKRDSTCTNG